MVDGSRGPAAPERTVIVYDGMHTDRLTGNGAFTFDGFRGRASTRRPPPSTFRRRRRDGSATRRAWRASTLARPSPSTRCPPTPARGNYAGVQVEPRRPRHRRRHLPPRSTSRCATTAVSFAVLEVGALNHHRGLPRARPAGQTCESAGASRRRAPRVDAPRFTDATRFRHRRVQAREAVKGRHDRPSPPTSVRPAGTRAPPTTFTRNGRRARLPHRWLLRLGRVGRRRQHVVRQLPDGAFARHHARRR